MGVELWTAVDRYVNAHVVAEDDVLREATAACERAGLPPISVTPSQGKLLFLLARLRRAGNVLEIGTLGGYSTIWLARAVAPDGQVVTIEIDPKHADVAGANITRAALSPIVDIRVGNALDVLPSLGAHPPFDLVFIDADKEHVPEYYEWALKLSAPGSLVIVDNVVREGHLIDATGADARVQGVRRLHELIAGDSTVQATTIQTVGAKGYDGFTLVLVQ